jgi:hypothetical protein
MLTSLPTLDGALTQRLRIGANALSCDLDACFKFVNQAHHNPVNNDGEFLPTRRRARSFTLNNCSFYFSIH